MVKDFEMNSKQRSSAPSKMYYSKPTLEKLGYVREMTLAGGSQANESAGTGGMACEPDFKSNEMCA